MIKLLIARFFVQNVDKLIARLTKLEAKLSAVAQAEVAAQIEKQKAIAALRAEVEAHADEAARAQRIAGNIRALVS